MSEAEAAAWAKLAESVVPLRGKTRPNPPPARERDQPRAGGRDAPTRTSPAKAPPPQSPPSVAARWAPPPQREDRNGLDGSWERKLNRASIAPDFTLDLHGHTLETAWHRLDAGLAQAKAMGARLVLVVTGKPRPVDPADRGTQRGAIRAKILDWLAAGRHGADIAAIRGAHRRHGGEGALYIVLKRAR